MVETVETCLRFMNVRDYLSGENVAIGFLSTDTGKQGVPTNAMLSALSEQKGKELPVWRTANLTQKAQRWNTHQAACLHIDWTPRGCVGPEGTQAFY